MTKQEMKRIIIEEYRELRENFINYIGVSFETNEIWIVENLVNKISFMEELLNKLGLSDEREKIEKEYKVLEEIKRKEIFKWEQI